MRRKFTKSRNARVQLGAVLLIFLGLFSVLFPMFANQSAIEQNLDASLLAPNTQFLLGTDQFGRHQAVRIAVALRSSMTLAIFCIIISATIGVGLGFLAAIKKGWVERLLNLLSNSVLAIPSLLVVLLIVAFAPGEFLPIYLGIALCQWVEFFRVSKTTAQQVLQSQAVQASKLLGFGMPYIFRRHLWPELAPLLKLLTAFGCANAVLAVTALGFIGVGLKPPTPELGIMMLDAISFYDEAPWLILSSGIFLLLFLGALALIAGEESARQ
jgi:peptide/nickel transport system permease protein